MTKEKYVLLPPEGGWGYIVTAALTLACNVTLIPMTCFGIIYGNFLASIGDETAGTTLSNGIFNSVFNITGLVANNLLQRFSYRFVGLIGAVIFAIGSFSVIFVTSLPQMIISFGIIQGFGMGLLFPALFTALNCYFDKKLNLMNNVAQSFMILAAMVFPIVGKHLMDHFGFRGTVAILAAFSFNGILAAFTLQPVKWHMKKEKVEEQEVEMLEPNLKPLLKDELETGVKYLTLKPRNSIISVGDRALSVTTINQIGLKSDDPSEKKKGLFQSLAKSLDLAMFKNPVYCNIALGLALGFNGDCAFISILPLVLSNAGFDSSEISFLMTVHFGSDFVARILLSIVSAVIAINNRLIFLGGSALIIIFRIVFVSNFSFYWTMATVSALGFLRCFIQTPLPCVISEKYSTNFSTAFSLFMVVCGMVSLVFGPLMSTVKSVTGSDVMVVHVLTIAYLICVISWSVELICSKMKQKGSTVATNK